ncbi:hypothetical protein [Streptomyces sp. NPDC006285]|uniref:hypothetical protein n=1 Tax=Streptomyces sp. NPDC006285 TaxID=3364742 RepID=UPI0036796549
MPRPGPGPGPGPGRVLVTVTALVAALGLGALTSAESASEGSSAPSSGATAAGWRTDTAHGFASLEGGTTGGAGGKVVTVTTQAGLERYAAVEEPYVIRVAGTIRAEPFGADIAVASDKTLIGVGTAGELVQGELHLAPGTHNVIIRNLTIRDSSVDGDRDCEDIDFDGYQMDTAHHVPVWAYGNRARGRTKMVIENSYYQDVQHPYQADATAELVQRGSILRNTPGRHEAWGAAFDPRDFCAYRLELDPAAAVPALVSRFSGPQKWLGTGPGRPS